VKLADDLIRGAEAIGEEIGEPPRRVFVLLEKKAIPGFKIRGKWYARRSTLRAHYDRLESAAAQPKAGEAA
jgi:hypothetical protein